MRMKKAIKIGIISLLSLCVIVVSALFFQLDIAMLFMMIVLIQMIIIAFTAICQLIYYHTFFQMANIYINIMNIFCCMAYTNSRKGCFIIWLKTKTRTEKTQTNSRTNRKISRTRKIRNKFLPYQYDTPLSINKKANLKVINQVCCYFYCLPSFMPSALATLKIVLKKIFTSFLKVMSFT